MESPSEGAAASRQGQSAGYWIATLGSAVTALSVVAGGAFAVGKIQAESEAKMGLAALTASNVQCEASLKVSQERYTDVRANLQDWKNAHQDALTENARMRAERESMLVRMQKLDKCVFIQEQIVALQNDIDHPWVGIRTIGGNDQQSREDALEKEGLEQRLAAYQQQLATCQQ